MVDPPNLQLTYYQKGKRLETDLLFRVSCLFDNCTHFADYLSSSDGIVSCCPIWILSGSFSLSRLA